MQPTCMTKDTVQTIFSIRRYVLTYSWVQEVGLSTLFMYINMCVLPRYGKVKLYILKSKTVIIITHSSMFLFFKITQG